MKRRAIVSISHLNLKHFGLPVTAAVMCAALLLPPAFGQSWTCGSGACSTAGSVGIGTTSPQQALQLNAAGTADSIVRLSAAGNPAYYTDIVNSVNSLRSFAISTLGVDAIAISGQGGYGGVTIGDPSTNLVVNPSGNKFTLSGGKVGIGTTVPTSLLHLFMGSSGGAPVYAYSNLLLESNTHNSIQISSPSGYQEGIQFATPVASQRAFIIYADSAGGGSSSKMFFGMPSGTSSGSAVMTLLGNGNVGIGTTGPQYPLSVRGTIGAGEVLVTNTGGWSDHVFAPGYALAPLNTVAQFIEANHHLPDIPSAKDVEEKGISLGKVQSKLLSKIEELTLHAIQAEKRFDRMDQENRDLKTEVEQMHEQLAVWEMRDGKGAGGR